MAVTEAVRAVRSELEKPGVAGTDMPGFWWADRQADRQVKQPRACVDRPPGAQAGGLLTRERPGVWSLGAEIHQGGGGVVM